MTLSFILSSTDYGWNFVNNTKTNTHIHKCTHKNKKNLKSRAYKVQVYILIVGNKNAC